MAIATHDTATHGLALSPILANFHATPIGPCLYASRKEVSTIVPGGLVGSCSHLALDALRYAKVQMRSRITVRRDGKSKMADCEI